MRILYYLEPQTELDKPLFRLGTVRNHLDRELRALRNNGLFTADVLLICGEAVLAAARAEQLLLDTRAVTPTQRELADIYPDYLEASLHWYDGTFSESAMARAVALYTHKLAGFVPDVVVSYEANAPFLARMFPGALFLHDTLGIFSRAPYPETSALDPFGVGKHGYLSRFGAQLRARAPSAEERAAVTQLKAAYRRALIASSPLTRDQVRRGHRHVVLLPLQVSGYFMFDGNCPAELRGRPQEDLVRHVLDRVPSDVGVFVTTHRASARGGAQRLAAIAKRYPNLLIDHEVQALPWASQHVLPHVDAVISVSSSVGLQALMWEVPVVVLGDSQLTAVASARSLEELPPLLARDSPPDLDGLLYHLLLHYYPLLERYHHDGRWFAGFLEHMVAWHRAGRLGDPFRPIDEPARVFAALTDELRTGRYTADVEATLARITPRADAERPGFEAALESAELVSFDVFDTLVTRRLLEPRALFTVIAPRVRQLLAKHVRANFGNAQLAAMRERAAKAAAQLAHARGCEEYALDMVYSLLAQEAGLSGAALPTVVSALAELECEAEVALCRPLERGLALLARARRLGKRVVLISDTYLDAKTVRTILARCGGDDYDALYTSSDYGVCKRSGALFERVRELEGSPRHWLHVGDHRLTDDAVPARLGIATIRVPGISERYLAHERVRRELHGAAEAGAAARAITHGVISRKFYEGPEGDVGYGGSPYRIGYEAGGPVLFGFVSWLIDRARRDGVTDLYFLARDGLLPKECAELLFDEGERPRLHYLYASRRLFSLPALTSMAEVVASASWRSSPTSIGDLLENRYGLRSDDLDPADYWRHGFSGREETVDLQDAGQRQKFEGLLGEKASLVLTRAGDERETLLAYLRAKGLFDGARRVAVVDIGHHASLQAALAGMCQRPDLRGYYFATFYEAQAVYASGLDMSSYLLHFEDSATSNHAYCRAIGMFEFLFLAPTRSIERVTRVDDEFVPVFVPGEETARSRLASELQRGVRDFCRDMREACFGDATVTQLSRADAVNTYLSFVAKPALADASLFRGVSFVDAFGGNSARMLVPAELPRPRRGAALEAYLASSWWKQGARVVAGLPVYNERQSGDGDAWQRKLRKLQRDPLRFVSDMPLTKNLRRVLSRFQGGTGSGRASRER